MAISNEPINKKSEDFLGYFRTSEEIFKTIKNKNTTDFKFKKSANIGLYGEWGSGKTSVINCIKEINDKTKDNYQIITLNVWNYRNTEEVIDYIIHEVKNRSNFINRIKTKLNIWKVSTWIKRIVGFSLLCITSFYLADLFFQHSSYLSRAWVFVRMHSYYFLIFLAIFLITYTFLKNKVISNFFFPYPDIGQLVKVLLESSEIDKAKLLAKLAYDKNYLVILDDIDRTADFKNLSEIFTKLSELFNIENFNFIFLFDRSRVESLLKKDNKDWTIEYINKHIDFHFYIPSMDNDSKKYFIEKIIDENSDSLLKMLDKTTISAQYKYFPENPRQIKTILRDYYLIRNDESRYDSDEIDSQAYLLSTILRNMCGGLWKFLIELKEDINSLNIDATSKRQEYLLERIALAIEEIPGSTINVKSQNNNTVLGYMQNITNPLSSLQDNNYKFPKSFNPDNLSILINMFEQDIQKAKHIYLVASRLVSLPNWERSKLVLNNANSILITKREYDKLFSVGGDVKTNFYKHIYLSANKSKVVSNIFYLYDIYKKELNKPSSVEAKRVLKLKCDNLIDITHEILDKKLFPEWRSVEYDTIVTIMNILLKNNIPQNMISNVHFRHREKNLVRKLFKKISQENIGLKIRLSNFLYNKVDSDIDRFINLGQNNIVKIALDAMEDDLLNHMFENLKEPKYIQSLSDKRYEHIAESYLFVSEFLIDERFKKSINGLPDVRRKLVDILKVIQILSSKIDFKKLGLLEDDGALIPELRPVLLELWRKGSGIKIDSHSLNQFEKVKKWMIEVGFTEKELGIKNVNQPRSNLGKDKL